MTINNVQQLEALIAQVKAAQEKFSTFSQEKVDAIFRAASLAANTQRIPLAKLAREETGMGVVEDKIIKNHFAAEYIYNSFKDMKTCGVISEDISYGTQVIAEPLGVIGGVVPTTNPTSTAIFKSLISLKTRNGIVFSPHPRAKKATCEAARIVLEAAVKAGAPENIIGWIDEPSLEMTNTLMSHKDIACILATGGPGMVKAAYSSGKPALGVGAGNTPAVIDEKCDLRRAVASVLMSKTFDFGMICASEQSVVIVDQVYDEAKKIFIELGAHILNKKETEAVRKIILVNGAINAKIVGQPASTIAAMAGFDVSSQTKVLIGEVSAISSEEPFAHEKLSPVLAMYRAKDFEEAVDKAEKLLNLEGEGHTSVLYTNQDINSDRVEYFGKRMKTGRILINTPSSHGGIGDLYNFKMLPSLTLGCGSWGGNSVSENVGPKHLLNLKTVGKRAENMLWHKLPKSIYFRRGCLPVALGDLKDKKRALIVTDHFLFKNGYIDETARILKNLGMDVDTFYDVNADPTLETVHKGVAAMENFKPDVIVALGGGSPMDAAKIMWVLYEHPGVDFKDLAMRFMDIRKRIYTFPKLGVKADFVAIPTTSGTGSEVTPFAVVTDEKTDVKYPIADYELTPNMAIIDADLVMDMPKSLTSAGGIDAVTHALESYVSVMANEYSDPQALQALKLLKEYLPSAYTNGAKDPVAREKVHNAATLAGIAFGNAFLGICHSIAHKIGAEFHIAHGIANAMLIQNVIRYNAAGNTGKQATFSQYGYPQAKERYAEIASYLGLRGNNDDQKVEALLGWLTELKDILEVPASIQAAGVSEKEFLEKIDGIAERAFDDQCTGSNPRFPLITDLRQILLDSYYGRAYSDTENKN